MSKRQLTILAILGTMTFCVLCFFGYLVFSEDAGPTAQPTAPPATRRAPTIMPIFPKITYKFVVGHRKEEYLDRMGVDITMTTTGSNTEQFTTHSFPEVDPTRREEKYREIKFEAHPGQFLYISLQESDGHYGWVRCEVYCDGRLVDSASSSGPFSIASCSGRAE